MAETKKEIQKLGKELKKLFMDQKDNIYLQNSDDHKIKIKKTIEKIKKLKDI